jgi:hypothetical protein
MGERGSFISNRVQTTIIAAISKPISSYSRKNLPCCTHEKSGLATIPGPWRGSPKKPKKARAEREIPRIRQENKEPRVPARFMYCDTKSLSRRCFDIK